MKIYVFPADQFGCGHFRMIWPAEQLKKQGMDVQVVIPGGEMEFSFTGAHKDGVLVDIDYPKDADVIVFQRMTNNLLHQAVPLLRKKGIAVVVDMDDDLSNIHQHNAAWSYLHPKTLTDNNWENAQRACDNATLVTVSTDALIRRYARHGRGVVLRNMIPQSYLDVVHVDREVFGWAGALDTHPDDVPTVSIPVSRLVREGADFRVIGNTRGMQRALCLDEEPDGTGPVMIEDWPAAVSTLGVGIAPLADTMFNRAKSWLKPLEYAALGVPCVVADRAEYRKLAQDYGIGIIASKNKQWYTEIRRLLDSADYRLEVSESGRQAARFLTIEQNAWMWGEAWEQARNMQDSL